MIKRALGVIALSVLTTSCGKSVVQSPAPLSSARQLAVVTTTGWDSITGVMRRYVRVDGKWREVGSAIPIVVGRTGLAWGDAGLAASGEKVKREGDGRSPAGVFPIDTAFGFAARDSVEFRMPYVQLTSDVECVDDTASIYYNGVVDRGKVARVDWNSSEKMRNVAQYREGAIIGYNSPRPVKGKGSCIFFHIWGGPRKPTVGCTAMDASQLNEFLTWLDPNAKPVVVQVPAAAYSRVAGMWGLPRM